MAEPATAIALQKIREHRIRYEERERIIKDMETALSKIESHYHNQKREDMRRLREELRDMGLQSKEVEALLKDPRGEWESADDQIIRDDTVKSRRYTLGGDSTLSVMLRRRARDAIDKRGTTLRPHQPYIRIK